MNESRYNPHDVEALCDVLQRVVAERDRLARVLAVEQGDASQVPDGWTRGTHFPWVRGRIAVCYGSTKGARWELVVRGGQTIGEGHSSALDAMEAGDRALAAWGGQ
jgi:hypothetical protein